MQNVIRPTTHVHPPEQGSRKNTTQTISMVVGFMLFCLGLCGIMFPAIMGLHMSLIHSMIILIAGCFLLYNGYSESTRRAYITCLVFGIFFGVHALAGFMLGEPGNPTVGASGWDPYTLNIIPNWQSLATPDHVLNAFLAVVLLAGAFDWRRRHFTK